MINMRSRMFLDKTGKIVRRGHILSVFDGVMVNKISIFPIASIMLISFMTIFYSIPFLFVRDGIIKYVDINGDSIIINIRENGKIILQEHNVLLDEITKKIDIMSQGKFDKSILVKGDFSTPYGVIIDIVSRVRKGGYKNVGFFIPN